MKPLTSFSLQQRKAIRVVFTDIDDTLSTAGLLTADAYSAMEALKQNNIAIVVRAIGFVGRRITPGTC